MTTTTTQSPNTPTTARGTGPRRILAAAVLAAPLLLIAGTTLTPAALGDRHGDDRTRTAKALADIAPHRGSIPASLLLIVPGLGLLIPAAFGLARLAGARPLALTGATLVAVGAPMGAATNAVSSLVAYRLTDPALPRATAIDVLAYNSPIMPVMFVLYLSAILGIVLLGVALWRSRALPRWQSALIAVGAVIGFAGPEGMTGALFSIPLTVGMALAARGLLTTV